MKQIEYDITEDECWICTSHAPNKKGGYPRKRVGNKIKKISHMMYEEIHGEGSIGELNVLHSCDNPKCINPNHLSLGTQKENSRQMMERCRWGGMKGENVHTAKLNTDDVLFIRSSDISSRKLAIKYGVNKSTILRVKNNKSWKEIK